MGEHDAALTRRDALKMTAKVAGVAAFATPTVVGVFSAPALGQTPHVCSPETDSDVVMGIITDGYTRNTNCGTTFPGGMGRYNGQTARFTLLGVEGTVQVGGPGTDNTEVEYSFYTITSPPGYECEAQFIVESCDSTPVTSNPALDPTPAPGVPPGTTKFPLPYCSTKCQGVKLTLQSVACCPT